MSPNVRCTSNYAKLALFNFKGNIAQSMLFTSGIFESHIPEEMISFALIPWRKLWRTDEVLEFQRYSVTDRLLIFRKWSSPVGDLICDVAGFEVLSQVQ